LALKKSRGRGRPRCTDRAVIVSWNFLATDAEFLAATLPDGEHAREQEAGGGSEKS